MLPVRSVVALGVLALASCTDATSPADAVAGLYTLQRVNGRALPTGAESVFLVVTGRYRVTATEVRIEGEGRWSYAPHASRAELRFARVDGQLRGASDGPACDAPTAIEEFTKMVGL